MLNGLQKGGYYFITSSSDNPQTSLSAVEQVKAALEGGARIIQYREKMLPLEEMTRTAMHLRFLTRLYKALLIIDDHVDIALAVGADGVHIGQSDMDYNAARRMLGWNRIIGLSVSDTKQAEIAAKSGADYISFSPLFRTSTKIDGNRDPCGIETLESVRRMMGNGLIPRVPLAGIGGINHDNYKDVVGSGADLICSIQPVVGCRNISASVRSFDEKVRRAHERYSSSVYDRR
ncbi:thiamine phosphate synthase [Candidatus Woesearchaeota archaeon CG10_big_fil_rev_8_21_14_0_10_44_13]|nr:MAG: thiamine phosphate synthase [Candidatus Woesearchaeota archaeon CG10_big_fil_rev_8_21_14_0_10_44_13]